ncbi:MAG: Gfo/Idh/MocA family protein [Flavisolibacter sp.]
MYSFGLIGCGNISYRHAEKIRRVGSLSAVCDIIPEKADNLAAQFNCKAYYSIDDLLKKEAGVDVIVVCTPNGLHPEHTIEALKHGKHVLCEKPMCLTTKDGIQMIETAETYGKKIFVVKQNRYNEPVQHLKKLLEANKLGAIFSFQINCFWNRPQAYYLNSWKGTKGLDGGILFTQFSHFVDLLYWILGPLEKVVGIKGSFKNRSHFEIEDTGVAVLKMVSGAIGTINYTINANHRNLEGSFAIFGDRGSIKIGGQYLNTIEWYEVDGEAKPEMVAAYTPNDYGFYQGSMSNHHKVYDDLILSLEGNGSLLEARDAIATIQIIEMIYAATDEA